MTLDADFASPDYFRDPAAAIEKLRAAGPVVQVRFPIVGQVWTPTTQALADQVLKDTETFTMRRRRRHGRRVSLVDAAHRAHALPSTCCRWTSPTTSGCATSSTRPFAAAPCSAWSRIFGPSATSSPIELFAEGDPADLVERYARQLPLSVICELLGLPLADRPKFVAWAGAFTRFTGALGFPRRDPKSLCDAALPRTAPRNRSPAGRRGVDRRDRSRREGRPTNQPR